MKTAVVIIFVLLICLIVVSLVFLYMLKPNKNRDYSSFMGLHIAHRGLHGDGIPENSRAAFKRAVEENYGVELDVQYTKDGKLVVFHDGTLSRMCKVDGKVSDYTYEELQNFKLINREGVVTEETIPMFDEVLEIIKDKPLVCEIKNHNGNKNDKLCSETYELLKEYKGLYCIESFSPFLVQWFRINHPEVIRGQLSCDMKDEETLSPINRFMMTHLLINVFSRPDFLAYRHQDMNKFGFRVCKKIFKPLIIAWTARGPKEQESAWKKSDSVIFEKYENANEQ